MNNEIEQLDDIVIYPRKDLSLEEKINYISKYYKIILSNIDKNKDFFTFLNKTKDISAIKEYIEENDDLVFKHIFQCDNLKDNDSSCYLSLKLFLNELLSYPELDFTDIIYLAQGHFSEVYKIGDYILKVGNNRNTYQIPNHPLILKSILKKKIEVVGKTIEVMPYVYPLKEDENGDITYFIYRQLRDDGIDWLDPKPENIGTLTKENTHHFYDVELNIQKESVSILENDIDEKPLNSGDYVILDVDFLYYAADVEKIPLKKFDCGHLYREMFCRYENELIGRKLRGESYERGTEMADSFFKGR